MNLSVTVTQLLHYHECPYRYRLLYRLGWSPSVETERGEKEPPSEIAVSRQTLGSRVHRVLELADFTSLESSARQIVKEHFPGIPAREKEEALRLVAEWGKSALFQETLAAKSVFRERSFLLSFDGALLEGSIDLLFISRDGTVTVLDYKTGAVTSQTLPDKTEEYRLQLELYLWASRQLFPEAKTVRGGLFFLRTGTFAPVTLLEEKRFRLQLEKLLSKLEKGDFAATPSQTACSRCAARSLCPFRMD